MVKNEKNTKLSNAMKLIWVNDRERMMKPRQEQSAEIKDKQGAKIRKHFADHPEHRAAISNAQKFKWVKIKKALEYCDRKGVNLFEEDFL
jgi:hypothetical protein